eukprot:jgi/Orpsp1_1/1187659/evm.model.d7180000059282.1
MIFFSLFIVIIKLIFQEMRYPTIVLELALVVIKVINPSIIEFSNTTLLLLPDGIHKVSLMIIILFLLMTLFLIMKTISNHFDYQRGFFWISRIRCGFKFDPLISIKRNEVSENCPNCCPCCGG